MASIPKAVSDTFRSGLRQDLGAGLFSLKCLLAAGMALFIALRIGLTHPYWAVTTSFIVANPLAGAVLSKAVARFIGTFVGAAVTVALVPFFVDEPIALSAALAAWLGLCAYCAILERTPRTYIFVLAGYTASIIGFPSVATPGAIFDIAATRVQEILIGITCGSVVHAFLFPTTVTERLWCMTQQVIDAAMLWSRDALASPSANPPRGERLQLAADLGALELLSTHLPFDVAPESPENRALKALQGRLTMVLPLVNTIENRIQTIEATQGSVPPDIADLVTATSRWVGAGSPRDEGDDLWRAITAHRLHTAAPRSWVAMLGLNLLVRLAELVEVHRDIAMLHDRIRHPRLRVDDPHLKALLSQARGRRLHRDHRLALRVAFGSMMAVGLSAAFWIATAWPDGATTTLFVGVCCSFFGNADDPAPAVTKYLIGLALGILVSCVYAFAILPRVTDYVMLIAVLAPAFLLLGSLLARPAWLLMAFGAIIGLCNTVGLAATYGSNFKTFANTAIALLAGPGFAIVAIHFFQTETPLNASRRMIRSIWRDVARRARGQFADTNAYMSLSLDRCGLLAPRLRSLSEPDRRLLDALIAMRIGYVAGVVSASLRRSEPSPARRALRDIARHFDQLNPSRPVAPPDAIRILLEEAIVDAVAAAPEEQHRDVLVALVSLHCNLFPNSPSEVDDALGTSASTVKIAAQTIV